MRQSVFLSLSLRVYTFFPFQKNVNDTGERFCAVLFFIQKKRQAQRGGRSFVQGKKESTQPFEIIIDAGEGEFRGTFFFFFRFPFCIPLTSANSWRGRKEATYLSLSLSKKDAF